MFHAFLISEYYVKSTPFFLVEHPLVSAAQDVASPELTAVSSHLLKGGHYAYTVWFAIQL